MKKRTYIRYLINKAVDIVFWLCMAAALWFVLQVFVFASFKIPSDSMEPGLTTGDNILVLKPTIGPRVFNLFASMRNEQTDIYRIPGLKKIDRNDILVFNFPHPNSWDKIEMHILKYYIKRCIGLPGDNGMNSQDSRYWGVLPEEYIVGKAWIIWKSVDPYTDKFRWDRFLKVIH